MSQAEELLNSLSQEDITLYSTNPDTEEHIIIDSNRFITVPDSLKRIAVQYDHNIETVTFDCPRYWDGNDLSTMYIYINYSLANGQKGRYLAKNITIDENDSNIFHFDWTITNEFTQQSGVIKILVCALETDTDGVETTHWNSEINSSFVVSGGLECADAVVEEHPDIINSILTKLDATNMDAVLEMKNDVDTLKETSATHATIEYVDNAINSIVNGDEVSY